MNLVRRVQDGSQNRAKIDQDRSTWESVFLIDFGGFWEPSWEGKSSQDRTKNDPNTHPKNIEKKEAFRKAQGR